MKEKALRTLEFTKVRERVSSLTETPMGRAAAEKLRPLTNPRDVSSRQQETSQAVLLLEDGAPISLSASVDIRPSVQRASKGGTLDSREFLQIAATAVAARALRRTLLGRRQRAPLLASLAESIEDLHLLEREVEGAIDAADGRVKDEASPTLQAVRADLHTVHEQIIAALHEIIASHTGREALQDPVITQRGHRYALPVRADHRSSIQGIVHDVSASGATVFIEPFQIVSLGNSQRELLAQEQHEVQRILLRLSRHVAQQAHALTHAVRILARLDVAFAKGRYARATQSLPPESPGSEEGHRVRLVDARHPLLPSGAAVPVSLEVGGENPILLITGPNTGGKTVALKTVGLLALMHQAGLHVPAGPGTLLPVFRSVFADIGDEQSIEQSLSTFSSHMTVIVETLKEADRRSLVLLDELGAGTDPEEGAALAEAVLADFLRRRITTVATSHHGTLKVFAHSTPGVRNASVEFDGETLEPTYRILMDVPGRSNALVIARRLGLQEDTLAAAQERLGEPRVQIDQLLREAQRDREVSRAQRRTAEEARAELDTLRAQWQQKLAEAIEEKARAKAAAQRELYEETQHVVARLRRIRASLDNRLITSQHASQIEGEVKELQRSLRERQPLPPSHAEGPQEPSTSGAHASQQAFPEPGAPVYLPELNATGTLLSAPDKNGEVEVQVRGLRLRVPWHQVRPGVLEEISPPHQQEPHIRTSHIGPLHVPTEVSLRGMYAQEAADLLEKTLHDAFLANAGTLRIVHGKGEGILRQMVHEMLRRHSLVESFHLADRSAGGEGVTIADLARR